MLRGPTIADVAEAAGVGTATVDRVLNNRGSVRRATRERVLQALEQLRSHQQTLATASEARTIAFIVDSGYSYNAVLGHAVEALAQRRPHIRCLFDAITTDDVDTVAFAHLLEQRAGEADALVVVARESPETYRQLRDIADRGVPFVCLTTDLPNSGRVAYVGNDQVSAGETAAYLMGRLLGEQEGKVLLVISAAYRCQEERELGFRRVLRMRFPSLAVDERLSSNDSIAFTREQVSRYIEEHGAPAGIYNVGAGNVGIAQALDIHGLTEQVVFIGHELNPNSIRLLENGTMDIAIGHDVGEEAVRCIDLLVEALHGRSIPDLPTGPVRVYTRFNCQ